MKLNKERKVYLAILLAAGSIWSADRVFFAGGPSSASAAAIDPAPSPLSTPSKPLDSQGASSKSSANAASPDSSSKPSATAQPAAQPSIAERLSSIRAELAQANTLPLSGFNDNDGWLTPKVVQLPTPQAESKPLTSDLARAFRERHTLTAVTIDRARHSASVRLSGRHSVSLGDTIDGFKLTKVDQSSARFESDSEVVELILPRTLPSENSSAHP
ncbi:MAG: hypothetical protein IBJ18_03055 [Phycisphaerales bacterium]|nr:hypothetical protein [Phycisphaerales bacterium]